MRSPESVLKRAVPAVLAIIVVEAVVSIAAGWPHQFAGKGQPDHVLAEFVGSGTALAPPLVMVVLLALVAAGLHLSRPWNRVATVLLLPLAALMTMGAGGETLAPATADVPRAVQLVGGGIDTLLSLALLVLAAAAVTRWRTARSEAAAV